MKGPNSQGFGLIGTLLIIFVIPVIGLGGWYAYYHNHKARPTAPTSSSTKTTGSTTQNKGSGNTGTGSTGSVISSVDGKISITLPAVWQIIQSRDGSQVIDTLQSPNCFTDTDSSPCSYSALFAPKSHLATQLWAINVEKSTKSPQQIVEMLLGQLQGGSILAQSTDPVNGYDAYYIEYKNPNTNIYYVIAHRGYVALFVNSQLNEQSDSDPTLNSPSSPYLSDFKGIAESIKFNL